MFYDRFAQLCQDRGVSPTRAAMDAGVSKSLVSKWKTNEAIVPSSDVLKRLSVYFGIPVSVLLGEREPSAALPGAERRIGDAELKFALFGGDAEITDAMYDEVLSFAAYVKQREAEKKKV